MKCSIENRSNKGTSDDIKQFRVLIMEHANKPTVFLSYSSKDKAFVDRLDNDLQKYKIQPWRDINHIRDGRSWRESIFEYGLPKCDSIIVYLTKNSIGSEMVRREINAALVRQLSKKGVRLLPYISDERLRKRIPLDIQSVWCRVWNASNYDEIFPSIVAEVWQSFTERIVTRVLSNEKDEKESIERKYKKLLVKTRKSPFTVAQEKDFDYIREYLNTEIQFTVETTYETNKRKDDWELPVVRHIKEVYSCSFLNALYQYITEGKNKYFSHDFGKFLMEHLPQRPNKQNVKRGTWVTEISVEFRTKLMIIGLIKPSSDSFSDKMYKFCYWLGYNRICNEKLNFKFLSKTEDEN